MNAPKASKEMVDVTPGVSCFYEIVRAADELEAFMARHCSFGGSQTIHIAISDEKIASELSRLIVSLQKALAPYRQAVEMVDGRDAARN